MWRRRMTRHSLVTTRLKMIYQHCGEARTPRSECDMSLKGAKPWWWRDSDDVVVNFRVARVWTVQNRLNSKYQ
ncbi:hypothetical protein V496_02113 [Pseudogymnoascus sp. VKM F-4515 (FW-2607)]|nr:hypothetical protein V496_02113 [Pseudogymnoascus sp. VKM F-4515 (FW-2607)]